MDKQIVEDLKDIADRCFMGEIDNSIFFQREHDGIKYCQWLNAETLELNRRQGNIICPFADPLAIIEIHSDSYSEIHPLCTCYKQKKTERR